MHVYIVYCVAAPGCHDKTAHQLEKEARFNPCVYVYVCILRVHIYVSMQTVSTSGVLLALAAALGWNPARNTGMTCSSEF